MALPPGTTAPPLPLTAPSQYTRAAEKWAKHADGCALLHREYLSYIMTTFGGVVRPPFVEWLAEEHNLAGLAAV